jgi:hypothetical protein
MFFIVIHMHKYISREKRYVYVLLPVPPSAKDMGKREKCLNPFIT